MARTKSTPEELAEKRKAKKEAEEKARLESNLKFRLEQFKKRPIPFPKYNYKVGDEVRARTANWDKIIIKEIVEEGKILLAEIHYTDNNYGKPLSRVKTDYIIHLEIIPMDLVLTNKTFNKRVERPDLISFHNQGIENLISKHYASGIDYNPEYQRGQVWTLEDKEKLVESIFERVGIGSFAFVERPYEADGPAYEILDGKQRLLAIIEYYEDKFPFKGVCFSELSRLDKMMFLNHNVSVGVGSSDMTLVEKYDYFLRLNTGGKPQSEEHLDYIRKKIKELQIKS